MPVHLYFIVLIIRSHEIRINQVDVRDCQLSSISFQHAE